VRDSDRIRRLGFPVFCRGTGLYGATKDFPGTVGKPVTLDGVPVSPGDWILADGDGILVIPAGSVQEAITAGEAVDQRERELIRRAKLGESTLNQLGISDPEEP
jgi:4-hydroxy-4-methyl-2-oxoglutarate aldolase